MSAAPDTLAPKTIAPEELIRAFVRALGEMTINAFGIDRLWFLLADVDRSRGKTLEAAMLATFDAVYARTPVDLGSAVASGGWSESPLSTLLSLVAFTVGHQVGASFKPDWFATSVLNVLLDPRADADNFDARFVVLAYLPAPRAQLEEYKALRAQALHAVSHAYSAEANGGDPALHRREADALRARAAAVLNPPARVATTAEVCAMLAARAAPSSAAPSSAAPSSAAPSSAAPLDPDTRAEIARELDSARDELGSLSVFDDGSDPALRDACDGLRALIRSHATLLGYGA